MQEFQRATQILSRSPKQQTDYERFAECLGRHDDFQAYHAFTADLHAGKKEAIEYLEKISKFLGIPQELQTLLPFGLANYCLWRNALNAPSEQTHREAARRFAEVFAFQYWSQGDLPEALQNITNAWDGILRNLGVSPIKVFDRVEAAAWIDEHAPAFNVPFHSSYHYALESDVFRVAVASQCASLYLDIDSFPTPNSSSVLATVLRQGCSALLFRKAAPLLASGSFVSARACPFFARLACEVASVDFGTLPRQDWGFMKLVGPLLYRRILSSSLAQQVHDYVYADNSEATPRVVFNDYQLGFVAEGYALECKPPFSLDNVPSYSKWQQSIPRNRAG
jgi:hypothetical protein